MYVALRGSSPATMAAGILLLSRARQMGQRLQVEIVGDPVEIGVVTGPAILHSAALAGCGVGREHGHGATVVVPGPASEPLAVSLSADGRGEWFVVDRAGEGIHPATRAWVRLLRDRRPASRALVREIRRGMEWLGCSAEPALFDLAFGAPTAPLSRIALALRAGRSLSGHRGEALNQLLVHDVDEGEMNLEVALRRLEPRAREAVGAVLAALRPAEPELHDAVAELLQHFALLPTGGILPLLDPAMDAVAYQLPRALAATSGNPAAQTVLLDTYRFLGGRFVSRADHPVDLPADLPPEDHLARWRWFCTHVAAAAVQVDRIWRDLMDEPQ